MSRLTLYCLFPVHIGRRGETGGGMLPLCSSILAPSRQRPINIPTTEAAAQLQPLCLQYHLLVGSFHQQPVSGRFVPAGTTGWSGRAWMICQQVG